MIVAKFGGGAMATAESIKKVITMVKADERRRIIVVSAPGSRGKGDPKVTDLLIAGAGCRHEPLRRSEFVEKIRLRYEAIAEGLKIDESLVEDCRREIESRFTSDDDNFDRYMDAVKAFGEEYSARFFAAALNSAGIPARFVSPQEGGLSVTTEYGNAQPLKKSYGALAQLAKMNEIVVFPGFYGITEEGRIATFSRGGSDLTGAILAAAAAAEMYENFSDVEGIFSANPRLLKNIFPKKIEQLTFHELRELSYSGFSVFHDEAIQPVMCLEKPVPIHVRDYRLPKKQGTIIVSERTGNPGKVAGIAADTGFVSFTITKNLLNREIGFGRRLLEIFERKGLSYEHSPSGIDSISIILKEQPKLDDATAQTIIREIMEQLHADTVKVENGLAMIAIVGEGMKETVGTAAKATRAIANAGANIEMISQGASEISIFFAVKNDALEAAVDSLYRALIGGGRKKKSPTA